MVHLGRFFMPMFSENVNHKLRFFALALRPLLWCLVAAVLFQNILLMRRNSQLSDSLALQPASKVPANRIAVGNQLEGLAGLTMDGTFTQIALPTKVSTERILVIAMSPSCPICAFNRPAWLEMTKDLKRRGNWRVVWISRDPVPITRSYCEQNGVPLENVVAEPLHRTFKQLGLESLPHTAVVSASG